MGAKTVVFRHLLKFDPNNRLIPLRVVLNDADMGDWTVEKLSRCFADCIEDCCVLFASARDSKYGSKPFLDELRYIIHSRISFDVLGIEVRKQRGVFARSVER